ncbi:MAG: hypothetical protein JXB50_10970 [Spirochaetes bacterium]|nr:hypothetical protein [Spirochaetota bacterium]
MKKFFILPLIILFTVMNSTANDNTEEKKEMPLTFKIKPSIDYFSCSIEFIDNKDNSYGNMVYERGYSIWWGSYQNNLKEPVSTTVDENLVQKLCRKYYSTIYFMINTIVMGGVSTIFIVPGIILTVYSFNYPVHSDESILLRSFGWGAISVGIMAVVFLLTYSVFLIVLGTQFGLTKKEVLNKLNNPPLSLKRKDFKISFDLVII